MRELLELIDEVLAERGWSARQASIEAIGTPNLIMNMRRGRVPSIHRLRALCDVLGLEYYVGRPRTVRGAEFDVDRLALALDAVAAGFLDAEPSAARGRLFRHATSRARGRFIRVSAAMHRLVYGPIHPEHGVADLHPSAALGHGPVG